MGRGRARGGRARGGRGRATRGREGRASAHDLLLKDHVG